MVSIVENNGILYYGAVGSCVLQFLCFTAVSCVKAIEPKIWKAKNFAGW